jgi:hypothetical protein
LPGSCADGKTYQLGNTDKGSNATPAGIFNAASGHDNAKKPPR